jgi:hypothetical protein
MKKSGVILMLAFLLAGGAVSALSAPSQAQVYPPPPPPPPPVPQAAALVPWVGPNTPWVYYNGDWFYNGVLYQFFGNKIGWAPYYAYAPRYVVRPSYWYAPRWRTWYRNHPVYWTNFQQQYPYWRGHRVGQHYNEAFYNQHHPGQGGGWHKGFPGGPDKRPRPQARNLSPEPGRQPEGRHPGATGRDLGPGYKPGSADGEFHPETRGPGPHP